MPRFSVALFLTVLVLTGCASQQELPQTRTDLDSSTDFRIFKTYRWFDGPFFEGDPATAQESQYKFLRDAVNTSLRKQNYDWQQFSASDLVMHIHSGSYSSGRVANWITYNWYKPWWGAYGERVDVSSYAAGTLIIDVIQGKTTTLVWRALIPGFFAEDGSILDRETVAQRIDEAVRTLPAAVR